MENKTNKPSVTLSQMDMVRVLTQVKNAVPATIEAVTEVKMNKKDNPYLDKVTKKQVSNIFINFNYTNSVNKRLTKEGKEADFVAQKRVWGEKLPGTCLVLHDGKYHLEVGYLTKAQPKVEYFFENQVIDKETIAMYLPKVSPSKSQGLDEEVVIRSFKLESVKEMTLNGTHYIITQ